MQAQERNPMESPEALLAWENQVRKNIERIDLEHTWTKVEERYSPELGQISYQYAEDLLRIQTIDSTGSRQYYLQGGTLFFARTVHASATDFPWGWALGPAMQALTGIQHTGHKASAQSTTGNSG